VASSGREIFSRRKKAWLLLTALLYALAGVAVYHFIDEGAVDKALSLPLLLLLCLLGLSLVNYTVRAWRWSMLCTQLGFNVPWPKNTLYYISGYALTATPGKAGEAVRLWWLKTGHEVPYVRSLPVMLADRLLDMWAVFILVLLSFSGFAAYWWQGVVVGAIVIGVSMPVLFPRSLMPFVDSTYRIAPRRARLIVRARRTLRAMESLNSLRVYVLTLVPTIAGWFAEGLALFLLLQYFGAEITLASAVFVFSFSMIVGAVSMLPGGLGSTEATMILLLRALDVPLDSALAATAIVRVTTFWFAVGIGAACMPFAIRVAQRAGTGIGVRPEAYTP
jgi:uncharacterized protein (TIRG00374 family)